MKEKKYNPLIEYIFFAFLTCAFAVITFILFKNQAVSGVIYHESDFSINNFPSDMFAYMQEMQGLDSGYSFPYPILFKLSALINIFLSPENSVALATCILNTLSVIATKLVIDAFLFKRPKENSGLNEFGFESLSIEKNSIRLLAGIASGILSVSIFFVSMLIIPNVYAGTRFRYLGVFSPNPFQNATYMAARPFAILSFACFIKLMNEYEKPAKENIKDYIFFAVVFLLSTMAKPSFTIVLGASAVLLVFFRFFKNKCRTFRESLLIALIFVPTLIDLLYQFKGVFVPDTGEEGGIGFCLGKIWLLYTDNMLTSIIFAMAFPLAVLAFNIPLLKKNAGYRFTWLFYIVSFCFAFFCFEKGRRAVDFNFSWSYMYGLFFSFFTAMIITIKDIFDKKRRAFGIAELSFFLLHLISGIWYFGQIFAGRSYY